MLPTMHKPRTLLDLSNREAREAVAGGAPVFLPVNPVEYHGPHLSLRNDGHVAAGLIGELHARLAVNHPEWPLLRAADLDVGADVLPGPGARLVPYGVAVRQIRDAALALADLGARAVVFTTFHGSPLHGHALEEGVKALERRGVRAVSPFNVLLRRHIQGQMNGERQRFEDAFPEASDELRAALDQSLHFDLHAGLLETSLTLRYAPETVDPRFRDLPPCPAVTPQAPMLAAARLAAALGRHELANELRFAAIGLGWHKLDPFPSYTGSPHLASAELGAVFAELVLDHLTPVIEDVLAGRAASPAPIMPWLRAATLGGRLETARVASSHAYANGCA